MPRCRRAVVTLVALTFTSTAGAAEREWLKLQAPSFGVISQLSEDETRRWAVHFDQFIGGLHTLYNVEEIALPPLTIVLFRQSKDFAPYHIKTESGQVRVEGFFGRTDDWSVIGLSGGGRDQATRRLIYHEAVHWFASANATEVPLWFAEGLAEALSTFRVVNGKGRWGEAIDDHVEALAYYGLSPTAELLRFSQDEALHGRASNRYYPQSWTFVHYLMFGDGGMQRAKLTELLKQLLETDVDTAFNAAFGKTPDEFDKELRRYLSGGRYGYTEIELRDRGGEMTVEPASEANVEFALGRLAAVSGNVDAAREHGERVVALVPNAPEGYEILAHAARTTGDETALDAALNRAIELESRDSWVFTTKARSLVSASWRENAFLDDVLPDDVAQSAADLYLQALGLRPRNDDAYAGLVTALLNVEEIRDDHRLTLDARRIFFPTNGFLLVGQAAVEKSHGNLAEATRLLHASRVEPAVLPAGYEQLVDGMRVKWIGEWVDAELSTLVQEARFNDAQAFLGERLADDGIRGPLRTYLERTARDLPSMARFHDALQAGADGKGDEAAQMLRELVADPTTSEQVRRRAEQALEKIAP